MKFLWKERLKKYIIKSDYIRFIICSVFCGKVKYNFLINVVYLFIGCEIILFWKFFLMDYGIWMKC